MQDRSNEEADLKIIYCHQVKEMLSYFKTLCPVPNYFIILSENKLGGGMIILSPY
jgi:hypothetical protein